MCWVLVGFLAICRRSLRSLRPTNTVMLVLWIVLFFHSGSIITRGWVGWKGDMRVGTICFMYVSCMFRILDCFSVFSCQNCGIVRIAEGTEDAEDAEGRGIFCVFCGFCAFSDSDKSVGHLSPRWGLFILCIGYYTPVDPLGLNGTNYSEH